MWRLAIWYTLAALGAGIGFAIGRRIDPVRRLQTFPDVSYYRYITLVAAFGVLITYSRVSDVVVAAVRTRTFNQLRGSLEYGPGLHTLRYAAILAGGIALYRLLGKGELRALHLLNVGLLLASAAISSRLSLVMALLIAVGLYAYRDAAARFPVLRTAIVALAAVLALVAFNDLRNSSFVPIVYGVTNPASDGLVPGRAVPRHAVSGERRGRELVRLAASAQSRGKRRRRGGTQLWQTYGQDAFFPHCRPLRTPRRRGRRAGAPRHVPEFQSRTANAVVFVGDADPVSVRPGSGTAAGSSRRTGVAHSAHRPRRPGEQGADRPKRGRGRRSKFLEDGQPPPPPARGLPRRRA